MAGDAIEYQFDLAAILQMQRRVETAISDLTPFFEGEVDELARGWFEQQFETKGQAGGTPWAPLSPTTLALKAKRGRAGMGILRDSDAMFRSLVFRSDANELREVTKNSYRKGTRVQNDGFPYAASHQFGWEMASMFGHPVAPRFNLPRHLVPPVFPDPWLNALEDAFAGYMSEVLQ